MSFQTKAFRRNLLTVAVMAGMMQISGVAFAQQTGDDQASGAPVEEVIVTGIRGSMMRSIDIKRNSGSVVDAITATDIGKLPDATIADSLQRVPGVQITRSGGEGDTVNIRGNGNITTTLNGEQMLAAGTITKVTPSFSDIPATMVSGISVYKSAEAKNVVSGLAGTIDLQTNRPFALESGLTAQAKLEATHGSLGKEVDPSISAFVGFNNDDAFGVSLGVTTSTSYLADYNNGSQGAETGEYGGWSFNASEASNFVVNNSDVNGDADTDDSFYVFQGHQAGNRFIDRERTAVNGSAQFNIADAFELTGDVFYTQMDEHAYFAGFVAEQAWQTKTGWITPLESTAYPDITSDNTETVFTTGPGNYYTVQSALLQARGVKTQTQTWAIDREALNTNLELAFDNGGSFTGKVRWVHGEGNMDMSRSIVDAQITDGSQIGEQYAPLNGDPINANPWGYAGVPAMLPDGTPVADSYSQIPIIVSYSGDSQDWVLPTMQVVDGEGNSVTEKFGSNMDRYSAKSSNLYGEFTNAELNILRLDGSYDFGPGLFNTVKSIDFGARIGEREVNKDGWIGGVVRTDAWGDPFIARWKDSAQRAPETGESYIEPISFSQLNDYGMIKQISDFHGTKGLDGLYFVDPEVMDDPIAWHESMYGLNILLPDAANVYDITDTTTSFYLQANLENEIFGMPYRGNIGLRYIETEFEITQSIALMGGVTVINGQSYQIGPGMLAPDGDKITTINKYDDLLPAVNLSLDLSENQVLRFAYAKTVATHDTDQLGGGLVVNRTAGCGLVEPNGTPIHCANDGSQTGNPNLKPNRSTNADLSYEWYFSESSMLSLGVFYLEGETATETTEIFRDDITDSDGQVRGYDLETGALTGLVDIQSIVSVDSSGSTRGYEVGYKQSFDFLEGFWSGFGMDANFTYSPSEGTALDYYGELLPANGNSEYQTNLALWYELDGLEVRIAHNYRSDMFISRKREGTRNFGYYQSPTNYVDASVSYEINDAVTVSLQAVNLTEEYIETYHQWESNVDGRFYNERRTTLGVQVKY